MKKRHFALLALLLAALFALSACTVGTAEDLSALVSGVESAAQEAAGALSEGLDELAVDSYFENGTIYTADEGDTVAEALAVKDGEIVFVGSAEEGELYKLAAEEVVDLQGSMLMPGMIDGHIHALTPDFFDFSLVGITTLEGTMQAIEDAVRENPDRETYFGFGYMATLFEGDEVTNGPKKERLDEICPDKPMVIYSFDGHAAWLNSAAFEYCGITKDTKSAPGGLIVLDDDGALWGALHDTAMSLTADFPLDQDKFASALKEYMQALNAMGYTSIMVLPGNGFFPVPLEGFGAMADAGELTMRVRAAGIVTSWKTEEDLEALEQMKDQYNSGLVQVIGAKLFADGVVDNESAFLLEPYADNPGYYGEAGWQPQAMNEAVAAINEMGLLAHVHSMGDAATRMTLNAIEYSQDQGNSTELRNALTHLQLVAEEDIPRFSELGAVAVTDPYWHYKAPQYWETKEQPALGERAEKMYPMKSFLDNGVHLAFASDYPVTPLPYPFIAVESGVTRNLVDGAEYEMEDITDMDDPRFLLWPEERLDVREMLRGFTAGGAYSIVAEQETGTLEVGKSADMIVLDRNLLTIDPLEIQHTQVLATYFQGALVYSAEADAAEAAETAASTSEAQ